MKMRGEFEIVKKIKIIFSAQEYIKHFRARTGQKQFSHKKKIKYKLKLRGGLYIYTLVYI